MTNEKAKIKISFFEFPALKISAVCFAFLLSTFYFLPPFSASAATISQSVSPLNQGLVGWWKLDKVTGAADLSGNNNNGTAVGGLVFGNATDKNNLANRATSFNGVNQRVDMGDPSALNLTSVGSFSVWFSPTTLLQRSGIVNKGYAYGGSTNFYGLVIFDGHLYVEMASGSSHTELLLTTPNSPATGWFNVVVSWDGTNVRAWTNGVQSVAPHSYAVPSPAGQAFQIGESASSVPFAGSIGEVLVWNRALSAAEAVQLYASTTPAKIVSPSSVVTNGLVGYWTMDAPEVVGTTVLDRSGNGNNGTMSGTAIKKTSAGKIGGAMSWTSPPTYSPITVNNSASLNPATQISYGAWVYITDASPFAMLIQKSDNATNGYFLYNQSGQILAYLRPNVTLSDPNHFAINTWVHYFFTYDGTTARLYKNGAQVAFQVVSNAIVTNSLHLIIGEWDGGCNPGTPNCFKGMLDDVRIYNRGLSASEVQTIYQAGVTQLATKSSTSVLDTQLPINNGLFGYWNFDNSTVSGTNVADLTRNNNATTTGSISVIPGTSGQAFTFDGSTGEVTTIIKSVPSANATYSFWANFSNAADANFFELGGTGAYWSTNNRINFYTSGGIIYGYASNWTYSPGWHQFIFTRSGGGAVNYYVDGTLKLADSGYNGGLNSLILHIGRTLRSGNGTYLNGSMDEFRIYNRILSANEVKQLYKLGK